MNQHISNLLDCLMIIAVLVIIRQALRQDMTGPQPPLKGGRTQPLAKAV